MSKTRYLSCAETAKLVRLALSESFPGVKFGVRSKTYSGGASIDVRWLDGPLSSQVEDITDKFEGSYFDGMIDYKGYLYHTLDGESVSFGANFIFGSRDISDALVQRGIEAVVAGYGGCEPITVEDYRQGRSRSWINSGGCDLERALNLWLSGQSDYLRTGVDAGMEAKKSTTLARVKFAGSAAVRESGRRPHVSGGSMIMKLQRIAVPSVLEQMLGIAQVRVVGDADCYRDRDDNSQRPYRAKIDGKMLRNNAGEVRKFRTLAEAIKATES